MLRELNGSDALRLKHIATKIEDMARRAPNLVLETIYDYFVDNPEVGAARAVRGRHGEQVGGGLEPKRARTLASPHSSDMTQARRAPYVASGLRGREGAKAR